MAYQEFQELEEIMSQPEMLLQTKQYLANQMML